MGDEPQQDSGAGERRAERPWPFVAYATTDHHGFVPEPAAAKRAWIEATPNRFARRCLPLTIANHAGWAIRIPFGVRARWNGETAPGNVEIEVLDPAHPARSWVADHFGAGIVTFTIPYVFRTPPGVQLLVRGAPNFWIEGAQALEGLVETDWTSASFTMNWRIIAVDRWVRWGAGDPICFLQPVSVALLEAAEPAFVMMSDVPAVEAGFRAWASARDAFNSDPERGPRAWQRHYYLGKEVTGERAADHHTRLALARFAGAPEVEFAAAPGVEEEGRTASPPRRVEGYDVAEVGDGFVVTDSHGGVHRLNHSAMFILECCSGNADATEIAEELQVAYDLPEAPHELVAQCLGQLAAAGLLTDSRAQEADPTAS
jgi:hypothetical protein